MSCTKELFGVVSMERVSAMGRHQRRSRGGSKEESTRSRQHRQASQRAQTRKESHARSRSRASWSSGYDDPRIPDNIEARNTRSIARSKRNAADDSRLGDTHVPDAVRDVISSSGQSLDASVQRAMEDRMGDSLGDVRVHTGPQAAEACEEINARAFTVGNHVAFNAGEYDPDSAEGQHVLAHELVHVRQQTGGAVSMLPQEDLELEIDPDPALEREAEETAQRVMEGGELGIQRMSDSEVHVQRYPGEAIVEKGKDVLDTGTKKVDDATSKTYRLRKEQLIDLVQSVETPKGLTEYLDHHDIDVASRVQDSASSPIKGATTGGTEGWATGTAVAGPVGGVAGALAGGALGVALTTQLGEDIAGKVQTIVRKVLGMKTDQEFGIEGDTGTETKAGKSRVN